MRHFVEGVAIGGSRAFLGNEVWHHWSKATGSRLGWLGMNHAWLRLAGRLNAIVSMLAMKIQFTKL